MIYMPERPSIRRLQPLGGLSLDREQPPRAFLCDRYRPPAATAAAAAAAAPPAAVRDRDDILPLSGPRSNVQISPPIAYQIRSGVRYRENAGDSSHFVLERLGDY